MKKRLSNLLITLLVISATSFADKAPLQVEMIIFKYNRLIALSDEQFTNQHFQPQFETKASQQTQYNDETAKSQTHQPKPTWQTIKNVNWQLKQIAQKLQDNPRYRVLYHSAWKQNNLNQSRAIKLRSGNGYTVDGKNLHNQQCDTQAQKQCYHTIAGTLEIHRSRRFTLDLNLAITQPVSALPKQVLSHIKPPPEHDNSIISFPIKQKRRFKLNQLNYIDHPLFGIILQVTKP